VRIGLADAPLMHAATGADAAVHLALRPGFLRHGFRFIAAMARLLGPLRPIALAPAHFGLWLLRAVLLKSVPSPVELTAVSGDRHRQLQFADGQVATGHAAAAAVWCWRNLSERPSGVHPVGEVLSVDALLEAMP
jgi:hypothetical protein